MPHRIFMLVVIATTGVAQAGLAIPATAQAGTGAQILAADARVASLDEDIRPAVHLPGQEPICWNDATRLALGQCLVAEARWRNRTEHSAIAHVLERRWRRYNASHPFEPRTFADQVRAYCHVHRAAREDSGNGWALSLPWGPLQADPGMGPTVDWRQWRDDWDYVRETVGRFERGELADPMPLAVVFGGAMDGVTDELVYLGPYAVSIENGARVLLNNRFYSTRALVASAARRRGGR